MCQPTLPKTDNALHALLSMVSHKSQKAVATCIEQEHLSRLQMGHCQRVLEFLCVVQGAGSPWQIISFSADIDS
jgi:hypothetical protein